MSTHLFALRQMLTSSSGLMAVKWLSLVAVLAGSAVFLAGGCDVRTCQTDADCMSGEGCLVNRCARRNPKPDPRDAAPAERRGPPCVPLCEVGQKRCSGSWHLECQNSPSNCPYWKAVKECPQGQICRGGACGQPAKEGEACERNHDCESTGQIMRCVRPEGKDMGICKRRCKDKSQCKSDEACVESTCFSKAECGAPCDPSEADRCQGNVAQACSQNKISGCYEWQNTATCSGKQSCAGGRCVGTVAAGGSCGGDGDCVQKHICYSGACTLACTSGAACQAGKSCRQTSTSRGHGICTSSGPGPNYEQKCRIRVDEVLIRGGGWDPFTLKGTGASPPDPYVVIRVPGHKQYRTSEKSDSYKATWGSETPAYAFGQITRMRVSVWDADVNVSGLSSDDYVASWRLRGHLEWKGSSGEMSLPLKHASADLQLTLLCK